MLQPSKTLWFTPLAMAGWLAAAVFFFHETAAASPSEGQGAAVQALVGANVFHGTATATLQDGVVIIRNGRISIVGPRSLVELPGDAEVIDLSGRWLVPGFINSHGHVGGNTDAFLKQLRQYAHYGVTTVVTLGGDEAAGILLRDEQASPKLQRARVFLAGPVITSATPEQARTDVAKVAELGADWVKIRVDGGLQGGPKMSPEVYSAVIAAAQQHDLPVAIHIWQLDDAKGVVRAGGSLVAHSVRDLPVDQELINLMKEREVCQVPTLTRELSTFVYADRPVFFDDPFFLGGAAPANPETFITPQMQEQARGPAGQFWKNALPLAQQNMVTLHNNGVGIAMGTDTGPIGRFQGYFEHIEMQMMVEAGMTPRDVLIAATSSAAACLKLEGLGTISPGSWADLVALDADPTADILNTRKIHGVWIAGNRVR